MTETQCIKSTLNAGRRLELCSATLCMAVFGKLPSGNRYRSADNWRAFSARISYNFPMLRQMNRVIHSRQFAIQETCSSLSFPRKDDTRLVLGEHRGW